MASVEAVEGETADDGNAADTAVLADIDDDAVTVVTILADVDDDAVTAAAIVADVDDVESALGKFAALADSCCCAAVHEETDCEVHKLVEEAKLIALSHRCRNAVKENKLLKA